MKTISIDFDGVLHAYREGWKDGTIYDEPVPGAQEALAALCDAGNRLVISTVRDDHDAIMRWLIRHGLDSFIDEITNAKPIAWLYIDDRALRFEDWPQAVRCAAELAL